MNPNFNMNKLFREQVKVCMITTFSTSTMTRISKILLKPNTRVLALVMFFENRKNTKKFFRVLSCVIYTIISNYVCIDYLGSEKKIKLFLFVVAGSYKYLGGKYENVLGFGIPDLLLNFLSCRLILKMNESVVILKCPHRIFEYYFNNGFIIFNCDENNLKRLPSQVKDRIGAEVTVDSEKFMISSTTFTSTSNTLETC